MADLFDREIDRQIRTLIARGALFVCNHSGGKDSQAMFLKLRERVPGGQLLVIHSHLPEVEWPGTLEHIRHTIGGTPLIVTQASKTLLGMVEARGMFPSPQQRQCTSDLKRGPIEREIRRHLKQHPEYGGLIVNCMGLRAEESANRARRAPFTFSARNSKAGREWYDWLPVQDMTTAEVFALIRAKGQTPHWAYAAGMSRLSCCFCIMASAADLTTAARLQPDLYRRYVELERRIGQTMLMPVKGQRRSLEDVTGISATQPDRKQAA